MAFTESRFALPENPILRAYEDCGGLGGVGIKPVGMGVFFPARAHSIQGLAALAGDDDDCGCGCHGAGGPGSCKDTGMAGMGDLSIDGVTEMLTQPVIGGLPLWAVALGGFVVVSMLSGRGSAYKSDLAKLKARHPRRGTRYARAAKEGWDAGRAAWE